MKINELISSFEIWTTNEERLLLQQLKHPVPLSSLSEHSQFIVNGLIRKDLVIKQGDQDPTVVANEKQKR